jgi:hypothetical protein
MSISVGDVVDFEVFKMALYACWGKSDGKTGFSHYVDWSVEKPVPLSLIPKVGEVIKLRVFKIVTEPQEDLPLDVTHGRTIRIDFAGARSIVDDDNWRAYLERQNQREASA